MPCGARDGPSAAPASIGGERRFHLGGALGAAILQRLFALRWARREVDSRAVSFTTNGERAFRALFMTRERPRAAASP